MKKENLDFLVASNAGDILLAWCLTAIPVVSPTYNLKYEEVFLVLQSKSLHLPTTQSEALTIKQSMKQMDIDITNILTMLQLPILDPLSVMKIQQLTHLAMSSLHCCILTAISSSILMNSSGQTSTTKSTSSTAQQPTSTSSTSNLSVKEPAEDVTEDVARNIVDKALEIFKIVGEIFKKSAKSNVYQNHICMGAWLLLSGIQGAMSASGAKPHQSEDYSKSKSPSKLLETSTAQPRVNLFKAQQSFGVLNAAIARHSIQLMEELFEDLKIDITSNETANDEEILITQQLPQELINFSILKDYTSLERIMCVFSSATLQQLLTFLATISYRKACTLKRLNQKNLSEAGGELLTYSDSTTYFNDLISLSCSDDESETEEEDEDEEDSESYLGLFK